MKKVVLSVVFLFAVTLSVMGCRPYISGTTPEDGAVEVPGNALIEARFAIRIDDSSFEPSMYYLELDGEKVEGSVKLEARFSQDVLVFTPLESLEAGKTYKATVKAGVKSEDDGSKMLQNKVFSFTVDSVKPEFISIDPVDGEPAFYKNRITITFNEPISSIDYVLKDSNGNAVNCMTTPIDNTVQIRPNIALGSGAKYSIQIISYSDTAGNINDLAVLSSFTTAQY
jgi:hypothetical protein